MPEMTLEQARAHADQNLRAGKFAEAEQTCRQILATIPDDVPALAMLAQVRFMAGAYDESISLLNRAAALRPQFAGFQSNLGTIYSTLRQFEPAVTHFENAIRLQPTLAEAWGNLGSAMRESARYAEAESHLRRALSMRPDYADARWNLSFVLLARGDFAEGWPAYESRLNMRSVPNRTFPQPMWDGSPLAGKTILLHAEQGIGDTFNFIRYAPVVAAMGARVLVLVQPSVLRLIKSQSLGVSQWLTDVDPVPLFDVHCPLLSVPGLVGTTMETIPPQLPPLQADAALVAEWKLKLASDPAKIKVGLVWMGNQTPMHNRKRSTTLEALLPLANVSGASFYSLQKGAAPNPATAAALGLKDHTSALNDFADTAALISALDLVISVDTGVAHLAAAMNKPTWVLLPSVPDWRYFYDRADSPWYPSMRLFRQPTAGDWATPIAKILLELQLKIAG